MSHMTSLDAILGTAGISAPNLTATVAEHRKMSTDMELVLADHFPVEDLAAGVEQFAHRLQSVLALTEGFLEHDDEAGTLARTINAAALADVTGAKEIVRAYLGLPAEDENGSAPIFGDVPLYGHPDLHCVTHGILDHSLRTFVRNNYLVSVSSGRVTPVPSTMNVIEAADCLTGEQMSSHV
jgi:hypothetical protein